MTVTASGTYAPVVIPDHTGTTLIGFWLCDDAPLAAYTRYPVLAWIVTVGAYGDCDERQPVICELLQDVWCLEQRTGDARSWVFVEDRECLSFEDAREYATERLHSRGRRPREAAHG
jgi:hypothetical protein